MELTSATATAPVDGGGADRSDYRAPAGIRLPATEAEWARELRADPELLADLAHGMQGPFHVLYPRQFADNLGRFQRTLADAGVTGQVYYGKKANKSSCWLQVCADSGAGVDVASAPELAHALGCGIRGGDIVVTGAAKSDELLWLAARHGCLLTVDAPDELDRLVTLLQDSPDGRLDVATDATVAAARLRVPVLLRVRPDTNPHSRFGFIAAELHQALGVCVREGLDLRGFSFHLNGYEPAPRAEMAVRLVDLVEQARRRGLPADTIDIGGGFACSYLAEEDWNRFTGQYRDDWFHAERTFSHFYPYHQSPVGAQMLRAILSHRPPEGAGGENLAELLERTRVRLLLEPGRALLDQAGLTVFPVQGYKHRDDYGIVTVDGLSASISEQWKASEYLPDPVLWPPTRARTAEAGPPVRACVGGASCLDYDMLTWRKVEFPRRPAYGDLLVYPNTAGYQMDKNETEFHQLRLPRRVVLTRPGGRFRWSLDEGGWAHRARGCQL